MKIDRLVGILTILLRKDKTTSKELSERFEVSTRTIARDIDALCSAGIPIVTEQGKGGGISIMEGFKIDKALLSNDDLTAVFIGLKALNSVSDGSQYQLLMDKLFVKTTDNQKDTIIIDLSEFDKSAVSEKIEFIKRSIQQREKISFKYYAPNGESNRVIEPYHIVYQWHGWYVWGYCTDRKDYRLFKIARLCELKSAGEKCEERDVPQYKLDRLWHLTGEVHATVKFDESVKWRIIDEYGTEIPKLTEDGSIEITHTWSSKLFSALF
ncbi:MAG: YafY family transcriptional regulator [Eubacterium sp.]|nr:YafY family transcriptional regulator [Eubacterium sp.]